MSDANPAATTLHPGLLQTQELPAGSSADLLNHACFCRTLAPERLHSLMPDLTLSHPHLFSATAVFLTQATEQQIAATVQALERVMALPGYQAQALARAPAIARKAFGPLGVCMGYDFHLGPEGPRLIEINTNAGGLLLNGALARAQVACCEAMDWAFLPKPPADPLEQTVFAMFLAEWRLQRGDAPLHSVAIVDDAPEAQYLAPEFAMFAQLFEQHGVRAMVVDAAALQWVDGVLQHEGAPIDMVYNRLTDFALAEPRHAALRSAYEAGAAVVTPHPHAHALYADKRNLVALSDDALLAQWGATPADRQLLQAAVPATQVVEPAHADALWALRRQLFFKPVAGYGGKAAYRGDKLTKRVWADILAGDFVAQALVPPSERLIEVDGALSDLKFDVRAYTYAGQVQLLAARMYSGQTTNFRTQGGGFAPVMVVPDIAIQRARLEG